MTYRPIPRIRALPACLAAALLAAVSGARADAPLDPAARGSVPASREWLFDATLDGRSIGRHTFRVTDRGGEIEVDSRASFDVRFLGFSVYRYEHHATERWRNGCLAELDARTDDNGEVETVSGDLAGEGFALKRGEVVTMLPACTMTFAYWNPAMRSQSRLLNPQTGEYLDVAVERLESATLDSKRAERFVIRGEDLEIELWYGATDDRWLGLDSRTTRGGLVSYRLAGDPVASARWDGAPDAQVLQP